MDAATQLAALKSLCSRAELWQEGGQSVAFLPNLQVKGRGGQAQTVDALLWPYARDGYATRLYLSEAIVSAREIAWTQCVIQGRTWQVCSWKDVPATLPWLEMLANHLRAFQ
jgi:hypothetical protein